ncbi:methyltransferase type 11 [Brucella lupini]|nr:methyltransferase type 11 [Brucella lupini]
MQRKLEGGSNNIVWGVLCTPQTLFIAKKIVQRFAYHNIKAEAILGSVENFSHDYYIVLSAPTLALLPPPDKRFIFQLEQSTNSRKITREYIRVLEDSLGFLEYCLTNIDYFAKKGLGFPHVHYLPIGAQLNDLNLAEENSKKYDFIFCGDAAGSKRTQDLLSKLQETYTVRICDGIYGDDLHSAIREAKAVINIHYCAGDLLEISHICECISLGVPVLSESSSDQDEYPEVAKAVSFFEEGAAESMTARASEMLSSLEEKSKAIKGAVATSSARFNFMMDRFLVAIGMLSTNVVLENPLYLARDSNFFALSLPETIERRLAIADHLPDGCELFDGIRHGLGWIGCGASFNALSRYALSTDCRQLAVIEDDADLPNNFIGILDEVRAYLDSRKASWDIFSGLMADVHPSAKIHSVEQVGERTYVTIDKMTSTVFNIYNRSALELLSRWDPLNTNAVTNTIDRYMESQKDLRVVVAIPFVVGHKEEAISTLWGVDNQYYTPMIAEAQKKIENLIREWEG